MRRYTLYICIAAASFGGAGVSAQEGFARIENLSARPDKETLVMSMDLNLDSLRLKSDHVMAYTPVLEDGKGNRHLFQTVLVTGRNEHFRYLRGGSRNENYPEAMEVRRENGRPQTVSYVRSIPYEKWMDDCRLSVAEDQCGCGDLMAQNRTEGIRLYRDRHPEKGVLTAFVVPKAEARKVREEKGSAFLDFPVNRTEIHPDYRRNPVELKKIVATIDLVRDDPNTEITDISIHGYASPEGGYQNNDRLARGRAEALKEYVGRLFHFDNSVFRVASTPEDWEGLRERVAESDLPDRAAILALIDSDREPDNKEWTIRNQHAASYRFMLENWYPALRHSDYVVAYVVRPFSAEEARQVLKSNPRQLSLNEMFMVAQTYEPGSPEFNEVFETAVRLYPEDPAANLNAACDALNRRELPAAARYLEKAGDTPEARNARGVLALLEKRYDEAERLLTAAKEGGVAQAEKNLEILAELREIQ